MKALKRLAVAAAFAPLALFGLTACQSNEPFEDAGEEIDEVVDDIEDAFD